MRSQHQKHVTLRTTARLTQSEIESLKQHDAQGKAYHRMMLAKEMM